MCTHCPVLSKGAGVLGSMVKQHSPIYFANYVIHEYCFLATVTCHISALLWPGSWNETMCRHAVGLEEQGPQPPRILKISILIDWFCYLLIDLLISNSYTGLHIFTNIVVVFHEALFGNNKTNNSIKNKKPYTKSWLIIWPLFECNRASVTSTIHLYLMCSATIPPVRVRTLD